MICDKKDRGICTEACRPKRHRFFGNFTVYSSTLVVLALFALGLFVAGIQDNLGVFNSVYQTTGVQSVFDVLTGLKLMPIWLIIIPFIGGIGQLMFGSKSCHRRDILVIVMTFITILLVLFTYPSAQGDGLHLSFPGVLGLGISFHIDMLGFTMLLITSILWFLVMVYAHDYMKKEKHCNRFFLFIAITYSSVLGAIMAGDLLTLFLFFEIMTFASYILVIHGQKEESYQAGYNYIFMGLIGGFAILTAIFLMQYAVGDLSFVSAIHTLSELGSIRYVIIGLLIFGFGIKAGMAPVHVWLPRAHPVAPTPASALLSGIMIKIGAYGILRVATSYYFPVQGSLDVENPLIWVTTQSIGGGVIWLGIITMTIGVFLALQQSNIKKMLAYHSISQMGYIVMGIGVAMYLGYEGPMGYAGALYHIINHALFKSLLFMVAGVVIFHTKESNMYKLGGLWRKLPLTATVCLIAALGISGVPLFNGFISKTILHHGIVEAYTYGTYGGFLPGSFYYAELIFIVISAGTVCSFIKLFYYVFLRKLPDRFKSIKPEYNSLDTAMVAVAVLIIFIGLNPRFILDMLIIPQLSVTTYSVSFTEYAVVGLNFFTREDLLLMVLVTGLGFFIFIFGTRFHLFHLKLPFWLRIEYMVFYPMNWLIRKSCRLMYGDQCPLPQTMIEQLELKNNEKSGFLNRFIIMTNMFNRRYEANIIKSDAFIYTAFITGILLFMLIMRIW